jgi:hypothetical protein
MDHHARVPWVRIAKELYQWTRAIDLRPPTSNEIQKARETKFRKLVRKDWRRKNKDRCRLGMWCLVVGATTSIISGLMLLGWIVLSLASVALELLCGDLNSIGWFSISIITAKIAGPVLAGWTLQCLGHWLRSPSEQVYTEYSWADD